MPPLLLLLLGRLRDAGTMRSLAVALFGLAGIPSPSEDLIQFAVYAAITALGLVSAAMAPKPGADTAAGATAQAATAAAAELARQVGELREVLAPAAVREPGR